MSKQYFFGEPIEAQMKRDYMSKCAQKEKEHEEFCRKLDEEYQKEIERIDAESRQRIVTSVISNTIPYLPELKEEDIDKICNNLKSLKKTL